MLIKITLSIICFALVIFIMPIRDNPFSQIRDGLIQSFKRDPFSLPLGIYHTSKQPISIKEKKTESSSEQRPQEIKKIEIPLELKAILIGEHIRLASINQRILTIGDEINGERVLEIHPDRVVLGKGKERRTILLDQSPLKIKVE